jgi:hypothetical protein
MRTVERDHRPYLLFRRNAPGKSVHRFALDSMRVRQCF